MSNERRVLQGLLPQYLDVDTVIAQEIQRQGVRASPDELKLWQQNWFGHSNPPLEPQHPDATSAALWRFQTTILMMERSKNIFFRTAADLFLLLLREGRLCLVSNANVVISEGMTSVARVQPTVVDKHILWQLVFSVHEIVNRSDIIELALVFVHESDHLQRLLQKDAENSSSTSDERIDALVRLSQDVDAFITEESVAYAAQTRAYIMQAGLLGLHASGTEEATMAAVFIHTGQNPHVPGWRQFLIENRMQAQLGARQLRSP